MTRSAATGRCWWYAQVSLALLVIYVALSAAVTFTLNRCCITARPFVEDRETIFRLRPNFEGMPSSHGNQRTPFHIDERGFRMQGTAAKSLERATILAAGDSFTFGWDVDDEDTYPAQLQSILDRDRPGAFQVVNVGIPGFTSFQARRWLRHWIPALAPRIVIVFLGRNDSRGVFVADARAQQVLRWKPAVSNSVFPFMFVNSLNLQWAAETLGATSRQRVSREEFRDNMEDIIGLAEANGADVILLEHWAHGGSSYPVRPLAEAHGLPYIATPELLATAERSGKELFLRRHLHPNEVGYAVIAQAVADVILGELTPARGRP